MIPPIPILVPPWLGEGGEGRSLRLGGTIVAQPRVAVLARGPDLNGDMSNERLIVIPQIPILVPPWRGGKTGDD